MSPRIRSTQARFALALAALLGASACSQGPALRGKIKGLSTTVADAEKNGAMTCAPREQRSAQKQASPTTPFMAITRNT